MSTTTTRKRGDTAPPVRITCLDDTATVNLASATSARLIGTRDGVKVIDTVVNGDASGVVVYALAPADTATAGAIRLEVEVTWPDGSIQTFPASGYLTLRVEPDLG